MPCCDDSQSVDAVRASIADHSLWVYLYIDVPPSPEGREVAEDMCLEFPGLAVYRFNVHAGLDAWTGGATPRGLIWRREEAAPCRALDDQVEDYETMKAIITALRAGQC